MDFQRHYMLWGEKKGKTLKIMKNDVKNEKNKMKKENV